MKPHDGELVPMIEWLKKMGRSDTTGWRWMKKGWLHPINIANHNYLTTEDIERFMARGKAGEFAQKPHGAAGKSAETSRFKL